MFQLCMAFLCWEAGAATLTTLSDSTSHRGTYHGGRTPLAPSRMGTHAAPARVSPTTNTANTSAYRAQLFTGTAAHYLPSTTRWPSLEESAFSLIYHLFPFPAHHPLLPAMENPVAPLLHHLAVLEVKACIRQA